MTNLKYKYEDLFGEPLLFSPGPVPYDWNIPITFSHRSKQFSELYEKIKKKLKKKFKLGREWDIIFTQGSGSSAIETVLSSIDTDEYHVWVETKGEFSTRAKNLLPEFGYGDIQKDHVTYTVLYETGDSNYNGLKLEKEGKFKIVDAVSALGYYDFPKKADVVITSSSKILGGLPCMGIIFYKEIALELFKEISGDYLDFMKHVEYGKKSQTPHTSLIPQFISLDMALDNPITKKQIDKNCEEFSKIRKLLVLGDNPSPVLTVKSSQTKSIIKALASYNIEVYNNPFYMEDWFQVSMFNYKDERVYAYLRDLLEEYILE